MTDILLVQRRIMDLCEQITTLPVELASPTAFKIIDECPELTDAALPIFEVQRGRGIDNRLIDADTAQITREYILRLFVRKLTDDPVQNETLNALAAECIIPVLGFFARRPALDLDGSSLVSDSKIAQDTGNTKQHTRTSGSFAGVTFRMQVVTRHFLED